MYYMNNKVKEIVKTWESKLSKIYGGELEIDYEDGNYIQEKADDEIVFKQE